MISDFKPGDILLRIHKGNRIIKGNTYTCLSVDGFGVELEEIKGYFEHASFKLVSKHCITNYQIY